MGQGQTSRSCRWSTSTHHPSGPTTSGAKNRRRCQFRLRNVQQTYGQSNSENIKSIYAGGWLRDTSTGIFYKENRGQIGQTWWEQRTGKYIYKHIIFVEVAISIRNTIVTKMMNSLLAFNGLKAYLSNKISIQSFEHSIGGHRSSRGASSTNAQEDLIICSIILESGVSSYYTALFPAFSWLSLYKKLHSLLFYLLKQSSVMPIL